LSPGHHGHDRVASSLLLLPSSCSRNGSRSGCNHGSNCSHAGSCRGTVAMIIASSRCPGRHCAAVTVAVAITIAVATIAVAIVVTLLLPWPSSCSRNSCRHGRNCGCHHCRLHCRRRNNGSHQETVAMQ
jgi:hypothetical protein